MIKLIKKTLPAPLKSFLKEIFGFRTVRNSDIIPSIKKHLRSDVVTILDIGCGRLWEENEKREDILFSLFDKPKYQITGIDIFENCIEWRKANGPAGSYVVLDVRNLDQLPGKFDAVIIHHVLEHFHKEESERILKMAESKALKQIFIGTPIGFTDTEYAVKLHGNQHERHLCGWLPDEFKSRGYKVYEIKEALLAVKDIG